MPTRLFRSLRPSSRTMREEQKADIFINKYGGLNADRAKFADYQNTPSPSSRERRERRAEAEAAASFKPFYFISRHSNENFPDPERRGAGAANRRRGRLPTRGCGGAPTRRAADYPTRRRTIVPTW